jgi:hypothetical protein
MLLFTALTAAALSLAVPVPAQLDVCFNGPFRGITATDPLGVVIGEPDRHDWTCPPADPTLRATRRGTAAPDDVPPVGPPTVICLAPAAPNPATTATRLEFALPRAATVELVIYGQHHRRGPFRVFEVRTLASGTRAAGVHTVIWDLRDEHGARVPVGIYRAVLRVEGETHCGDIEVR